MDIHDVSLRCRGHLNTHLRVGQTRIGQVLLQQVSIPVDHGVIQVSVDRLLGIYPCVSQPSVS